MEFLLFNKLLNLKPQEILCQKYFHHSSNKTKIEKIKIIWASVAVFQNQV